MCAIVNTANPKNTERLGECKAKQGAACNREAVGCLVLVGGGGGKLTGGRHIELPETTPLANVHLTVLRKVGVERESFGDSTGTIAGV